MLTLTTPDGQTVTAPDELHLAAEFGEQVDGIDWEALCPFEDHTLTWEYIEFFALVRDDSMPGYRLTDSEGS
ncbi:hypothetical protein [Agromyces sp. GXQ0307]|uniref:hypothetical protein n=1 Tax=Agromyces sp. GXQ0307 TaxID=3377835 RepID=UPI00383B08CE